MANKKIKGYPNYEVSNTGEIFSCERTVKCFNWQKKIERKSLKFNTNDSGYSVCFLYKTSKKRRLVRVHRIVAEAFIEKSGTQINHINGIKKDNRVENLEWCNGSHNTSHAYKLGLIIKLIGDKNPNHKLSNSQCKDILNSMLSNNELAKMYGVCERSIRYARFRAKRDAINDIKPTKAE